MTRSLLRWCLAGIILVGLGGCGVPSGPDPLRALLDRPGLQEVRLRVAVVEGGKVVRGERTITRPADLGEFRAILGAAQVMPDPLKWEEAGDLDLRFAAGPPVAVDLYDSCRYIAVGNRPNHVYYQIAGARLRQLGQQAPVP